MTPRDLGAGLAAAAAALLAMAGTAATGLLLLDADRIGGFAALTAAVVALAVGAPAKVDVLPPTEVPFTMQGVVETMPLGVSLVGAVVLGVLLLRRGREGLLVRGAVAAAAVTAGLVAVARLARATVTFPLPDGGPAAGGTFEASACPDLDLPFGGGSLEALDARISVAAGPTAVAAAAAGWALAVVAGCWLIARWRCPAVGLRTVLWAAGAIAAAALLAAWASGGAAAAGGVLLLLPLAVVGALPIGIGVPWTVRSDGLLACALDGAEPLAPGGPLMWTSGGALLCLCIVAAIRAGDRPGSVLRRAAGLAVRLAPVVGAALAVMTLLSRVSVSLTAFGSVSVVDAHLVANPLLALGVGILCGAAAGFAGSLLVDGVRRLSSVSWPPWKDQVRR